MLARDQGLDRVFFHKKQQEVSAEYNIKHTKRNTQAPHHFQARAEAFLDPSIFACPQILGGKIGDSVADGGKGSDDHIVELHRGAVACHDGSAETVDHALDDDVSY